MAKSVRRVVLGVTGSIAAYKAPLILRSLIKKGVEVRCVLTPNAAHFVSPLTLATLSKHPVAQTMHDPALWEMAHLSLSSWARSGYAASMSNDARRTNCATSGQGSLVAPIVSFSASSSSAVRSVR